MVCPMAIMAVSEKDRITLNKLADVRKTSELKVRMADNPITASTTLNSRQLVSLLVRDFNDVPGTDALTVLILLISSLSLSLSICLVQPICIQR